MARKPLTDEDVEIAIAAIMAALFPNCETGWGDWSRCAARGEWF